MNSTVSAVIFRWCFRPLHNLNLLHLCEFWFHYQAAIQCGNVTSFIIAFSCMYSHIYFEFYLGNLTPFIVVLSCMFSHIYLLFYRQTQRKPGVAVYIIFLPLWFVVCPYSDILILLFLCQSSPDPIGRVVWGMGLRPPGCWDCGFVSRRRHGCLSLVSDVCSQVEVSARGWSIVQRSPTLRYDFCSGHGRFRTAAELKAMMTRFLVCFLSIPRWLPEMCCCHLRNSFSFRVHNSFILFQFT
jgi:hypothetical protein